MRHNLWFLTKYVGVAAALAVGCGCGDDRKVHGLAPDSADPDDARGPELPLDAAPPDTGSDLCSVRWHDLQFGSELDDQVWGLTSDADHNLYVSGFEHGVTGVTNIEPDGNARGVVIKLDATGAVQWKAMLDTDAADTIEAAAVDPESGLVYAVGRTSGAFEGFVNHGAFDSVLVTLDAHGQTTTILQAGDDRPQHPARLSLGANHVIAVAGFDDTYAPGNHVEAWEDGFIASFGWGAPPVGFSQSFVQKVPLTMSNRLTDVVVDRDGSGAMYITSYVSAPRAVSGIFVKKLDAAGAQLWATRISNMGVDAINAVALSPSNELFVAGATVLPLGGPTAGQQDAFVAKIDKATGAVVWTIQAGSAGSDFPTALAFDKVGQIYIAGTTLGSLPGTGDAGNRGGVDVFAMKLDPAGRLLSTWQTGTAEHDQATSMTVDGCGNVVVAGYSKGRLVEGEGAGGDDMFVIRAAL